MFAFANQTTFPSYGYFLELGYTTWPERWDVKSGDSLMHGCGIPGPAYCAGVASRIRMRTQSSKLHADDGALRARGFRFVFC